MLGLAVHVWGQRVYGNSVYFVLNFAVNLTALKMSVGRKSFRLKTCLTCSSFIEKHNFHGHFLFSCLDM